MTTCVFIFSSFILGSKMKDAEEMGGERKKRKEKKLSNEKGFRKRKRKKK